MENLTKHQLVLVALLISFVTSIATGIVTVSLMDQAPKAVTQTINRVVERTVERVVTEPSKSKDIVRETIVVKEEDKIIEAIEKNAKSLVRIYKTEPTLSAENPLKAFVGLGIIISEEGDIATDAAVISPASSYSVILSDSKEYAIKIRSTFPQENKIIEFLKIIPNEKETIFLTPAILADSDTLKLGQTVIFLGGKLMNSVAIGIITGFIESNNYNFSSENAITPESVAFSGQNASTTVSSSAGNLVAAANEPLKENTVLGKMSKELLIAVRKSLIFIETNIVSNDNTTGSPFLNLSSEVAGIRVKSSDGAQTMSFVPINEVKKSFATASTPTSSAKQDTN